MKFNFDIVDFHAHILPEADHGSSSLEMSLWQLASAKKYGVTRIIATPHFYPHVHTVESFIKRRNKAYNLLKSSINSDVEILLGAEALICRGFEDLPGLEKLFINGTNTLLLELPETDMEECYYITVQTLVRRGIEVVIAHANRYPYEVIERMIKAGAVLQLNANSLLGFIKRRDVESWIERDVVWAIGSDIHRKDASAYRKFALAIHKMGKKADFIKEKSDLILNKSK